MLVAFVDTFNGNEYVGCIFFWDICWFKGKGFLGVGFLWFKVSCINPMRIIKIVSEVNDIFACSYDILLN